eukprot:399367-Rhodomonas_salina.2
MIPVGSVLVSEVTVNGTRSLASPILVLIRMPLLSAVTAPSHRSDWHTDSVRTHSPAPELGRPTTPLTVSA